MMLRISKYMVVVACVPFSIAQANSLKNYYQLNAAGKPVCMGKSYEYGLPPEIGQIPEVVLNGSQLALDLMPGQVVAFSPQITLDTSTGAMPSGYWCANAGYFIALPDYPDLTQIKYAAPHDLPEGTFISINFQLSDGQGQQAKDTLYARIQPVLADAQGDKILEGTLLDDEGNPVAGAEVEIAGQTVLTDAEGNYQLAGLTEGQHTITASKEGLHFTPVTAEISTEQPVASVPTQVTTNELIIHIKQAPEQAFISEYLTYEYDIINGSGDTLKKLKFVSQASGQGDIISIQADRGDCLHNRKYSHCKLDSIAQGEIIHVTVVVKAKKKGSFKNRVSLNAQKYPKQRLTQRTQINRPEGLTLQTLEPIPVESTAGLIHTYIYQLNNQGPVAAQQLKFKSLFPQNAEVLSVNSEHAECQKKTARVDCTLDSLAAGQATLIYVTVQSKRRGNLVNNVHLQSAQYAKQKLRLKTKLHKPTGLALQETPVANTANIGDSINYAFRIMQDGQVNASRLQAKFVLNHRGEFTAVTPNTDECDLQKRIIKCNWDTLDVGAYIDINVTAYVQRRGTLRNTAYLTSKEYPRLRVVQKTQVSQADNTQPEPQTTPNPSNTQTPTTVTTPTNPPVEPTTPTSPSQNPANNTGNTTTTPAPDTQPATDNNPAQPTDTNTSNTDPVTNDTPASNPPVTVVVPPVTTPVPNQDDDANTPATDDNTPADTGDADTSTPDTNTTPTTPDAPDTDPTTTPDTSGDDASQPPATDDADTSTPDTNTTPTTPDASDTDSTTTPDASGDATTDETNPEGETSNETGDEADNTSTESCDRTAEVLDCILNNQATDIVRDLQLGKNAQIRGGQLTGKIQGQAAKPALLEALNILPDTQLSHVLLGKQVQINDVERVQLGAGVLFTPDAEIPVGLDLSGALSRLHTANTERLRDFGRIDLQQDVRQDLADNSLLAQINALPELQALGLKVQQDAHGHLQVDIELEQQQQRLSLQATQVEQTQALSEGEARIGVHLNPDHSIRLITAAGRSILTQPSVNAPQQLLAQLPEEWKIELLDSGNVKVFAPELNTTLVLRPEWLLQAVETAPDSPIQVHPHPSLPTLNSFSWTAPSDDQQSIYQQMLHPAPAYPEQLREWVASLDNADMELHVNGTLILTLEGERYEAVFDSLLVEDETQQNNDALQFRASDKQLEGSEVMGVEVVWMDGSFQMILLKLTK